jgi:hypothetical protein
MKQKKADSPTDVNVRTGLPDRRHEKHERLIALTPTL